MPRSHLNIAPHPLLMPVLGGSRIEKESGLKSLGDGRGGEIVEVEALPFPP